MKFLLHIVISVMVLLHGPKIECCLENERAGLIQIESYFSSVTQETSTSSDDPHFPRWHVWDNTSDCCDWEGVMCSPSTGRVTQLLLEYKVYTYEPWHLNMSFFRPFEELMMLDLSWNHIGNLVESQGLCGLKKLQELIFYYNFLSEDLPRCLWNSTSLRALDLSYNSFTGSLPPYINIPSLEWLLVSRNKFQGNFSFNSLTNQSRVKGLMLSYNNLQVKIDESAYSSSTFQLQALGLAHCGLDSQAKAFWRFMSNQSKLQYIDLSDNGLGGSFPSHILHKNSNLKSLSLQNNSLSGSLDFTEHRNNLSLVHLDISYNLLSGNIPQHIAAALPAMKVLVLFLNDFEGHIPSSVCNMTFLRALDLSFNYLSGKLPRQLFSECPKLQFLHLISNNLEGEMFPQYMNLSGLLSLAVAGNKFVGTIKESLAVSEDLLSLDISYNEITGELPSGIGSLSELQVMSLKGNLLHGNIPIQTCQLGMLVYLDISENEFYGQFPCDTLYSLEYLHMHGNSFTGAIPLGLGMSSKLVTLDLADNLISGVIPDWIGLLSKLATVFLQENRLQGDLPITLCDLHLVNILDVSRNNLSGPIPSCLGGLSFGATEREIAESNVMVPVEGDKLRFFNVEFSLPFYDYVQFSEFESVDLIVKGRYAAYRGTMLQVMSSLDLSCNQLAGEVPPEIGDLAMLNALNLSHNFLFGPIPESFSKLKSIESLDLSNNKLSGVIPSQLASLNFLEIFNVSYNNLSGQVPETEQFGTFDESNYRGNTLLCGPRLLKSCTAIAPPYNPLTKQEYEEDTQFDLEVFLWSFGMTYTIVLLTFVLVLYINVHWRRAWFAFIDLHLLWWLY